MPWVFGENAHRRLARAAYVILLVLGTLAPAVRTGSGVVPPDFEDRLVVSIQGIPLDIVWTPDGRIVIPTKDGLVWIYANGALIPRPAVDLSGILCTDGERGIAGVDLHPDFSSNHYIYIYYTFNKFGTCNESEVNGPVNRVSRFVLSDESTIDPTAELVLLDTPPLRKNWHNGGDLEFGKDGYLYVTVGDGGTSGLGWPRDPGKLLGKILRVTDSGAIPADNPFTGAGTARCNLNGLPPPSSPAGTKCQEVFAQGLRNPFRFAFDPNSESVRFFINDVGEDTWEEVNLGQPGADYGWPVREGPCAKGSTTDCGPPPLGMTNPVYWYGHNVTRNGSGCASVTGGAFVPDGVWPESFSQTYLLADYVCDQIWKLGPDGRGGFTISDFVRVADAGPISARFGPHGTTKALYYVTLGGQLRRIAFTGTLNRAPTAGAVANPAYGHVPLEVGFDGSASNDADGDILSYEWDFGDGSPFSSGPMAFHTYATTGTFFPILTVSDGRGGTDSISIRVDAGNTPPEPRIESPPVDSLFAVGDTFLLHGSATDPEDGSLPDTSLTWEVVRHHASHVHPFLSPTQGNDITITAPEPEYLAAAQTSFLEIRLTVADSRGLPVTVTRELRPRFVNVTFVTDPTGLFLSVVELSLKGPSSVLSWDKYNLVVNAPNQTDSEGQVWVFDSWSDGGSASHIITTPGTAATYTARFGAASKTLTFTPTDDTYVSPDSPDENFGSDSALVVDNSPVRHILVKFSISGIGPGRVQEAKMLLYTINPSVKGGDFRRASPDTWTEDTVTWNTAPTVDSEIVFSMGPVTTGAWTEANITSLVTSDGTLNVIITSSSGDGAQYYSKEGPAGFSPRLVVTLGPPLGPDSSPPSKTEGLRATVGVGEQVDLSWQASTDNIGVAGYDILRDGIRIASVEGSTTYYSDRSVSPSTSYAYTVVAFDSAGNRSPPSDASIVTTPAACSRTLVFTPTDDAYITAGTTSGNGNFGREPQLVVDYGPLRHFLIKFNLEGVGQCYVASAKLRLFQTDSSNKGGDFQTTATTWSEWTVTWNNAPAGTGTIASLGSVKSGTWYEVDLTSVVRADGPVSLRASSLSSDGAFYSSKEGANSPQLVVTLTASPPPPPPTTRTLTFTPTDDAYIMAGSSNLDANFGSATQLIVDNSPLRDFLLKFTVTGIGTSQVVGAKLRLYQEDSSPRGGDIHLCSPDWSEDSVAWSNAPAADPTVIASLGSVSVNRWYEIDLTATVSGDGVISLRITTPNSDGAFYSSKEGTNAPQLVITVSG